MKKANKKKTQNNVEISERPTDDAAVALLALLDSGQLPAFMVTAIQDAIKRACVSTTPVGHSVYYPTFYRGDDDFMRAREHQTDLGIVMTAFWRAQVIGEVQNEQ